MSEAKKEEARVTLMNRGQRSYEVVSDGKVVRHSPGTTMSYSAEEAKKMEGYRDLIDITKMPGQVDANKLKADNAKLLADNAALQAQLDALQVTGDKEAVAEEKKPKGKKHEVAA